MLAPFDSSTKTFKAGGGGIGYYRVPSLIGIWATAPFFHNNALGLYTRDQPVLGRMAAFNHAMKKLLWPESGTNSIVRTTIESYIEIPTALTEFLKTF